MTACRGQAPRLDGTDPFALAALAAWHRVDGVMSAVLDRHDIGPVDVRTHFRTAHGATAARWGMLDDHLDLVLDVLDDVGIRPTLLKGAALVRAGIVPAGERPMADLDVLVDPADAWRAHRRLVEVLDMATTADERGWLHAQARHHQLPALYARDGVTLEIHHRLLHRGHPRHRLDATARRGRVEVGDPRADRLDDVGMWLHLAVHFWEDRRRGTGGALLQLRDLDLLLRRIDPDQLAAASSTGEAAELVGMVARVLQALLETPEAERLLERLGVGGRSDMPERWAQRRVLGRRPPLAQLVHPTPDVDYTAWRLATRLRRQLWPPRDVMHRLSGHDATRRAHLAALVPTLVEGARHPGSTLEALRLDRWAHEVVRDGTRDT